MLFERDKDKVFYLNCAREFLFCEYAVKFLVPDTAFRLVDGSQAPRDTAWAHTSKNYVARCDGILASKWSEHWRQHTMFISRQPIRGQAESKWQKTVSVYPNRRQFPLKRQNLTALFSVK